MEYGNKILARIQDRATAKNGEAKMQYRSTST